MSNLFHIITETGRTVQFTETCYIPYFSDSLQVLPIEYTCRSLSADCIVCTQRQSWYIKETYLSICYSIKWKKHSERCKHCALCKAEPKIFALLQTPYQGHRTAKNLISWRWSLPSPRNPVWWISMHAISSYHGNRSTNTQPPPVANRQDR